MTGGSREGLDPPRGQSSNAGSCPRARGPGAGEEERAGDGGPGVPGPATGRSAFVRPGARGLLIPRPPSVGTGLEDAGIAALPLLWEESASFRAHKDTGRESWTCPDHSRSNRRWTNRCWGHSQSGQPNHPGTHRASEPHTVSPVSPTALEPAGRRSHVRSVRSARPPWNPPGVGATSGQSGQPDRPGTRRASEPRPVSPVSPTTLETTRRRSHVRSVRSARPPWNPPGVGATSGQSGQSNRPGSRRASEPRTVSPVSPTALEPAGRRSHVRQGRSLLSGTSLEQTSRPFPSEEGDTGEPPDSSGSRGRGQRFRAECSGSRGGGDSPDQKPEALSSPGDCRHVTFPQFVMSMGPMREPGLRADVLLQRGTKPKVGRAEPGPGPEVGRAERAELGPGPEVGRAERAEPGPGPEVGRAEPGPGPEVGRAEPGPEPEVGRAEPGPGPEVGRAERAEPGPEPEVGRAERAEPGPGPEVGRAERAEPGPGPEVGRAEPGPGPEVGRAERAEPGPGPEVGRAERAEPGPGPEVGRAEWAEPGPGPEVGRAEWAEPGPGPEVGRAEWAEPGPEPEGEHPTNAEVALPGSLSQKQRPEEASESGKGPHGTRGAELRALRGSRASDPFWDRRARTHLEQEGGRAGSDRGPGRGAGEWGNQAPLWPPLTQDPAPSPQACDPQTEPLGDEGHPPNLPPGTPPTHHPPRPRPLPSSQNPAAQRRTFRGPSLAHVWSRGRKGRVPEQDREMPAPEAPARRPPPVKGGEVSGLGSPGVTGGGGGQALRQVGAEGAGGEQSPGSVVR
ncbi:collagen alpha-1(I) chain-like [Antechinus flavipes]|uniref:collagen alpha-1(I) chain-like n=1 Tax=Antechinus flavipes TaxID=38775 RepID=UPI0022363E9D|nr:collagen alpha-1(I) chain-like [Antechinus flavipes]